MNTVSQYTRGVVWMVDSLFRIRGGGKVTCFWVLGSAVPWRTFNFKSGSQFEKQRKTTEVRSAQHARARTGHQDSTTSEWKLYAASVLNSECAIYFCFSYIDSSRLHIKMIQENDQKSKEKKKREAKQEIGIGGPRTPWYFFSILRECTGRLNPELLCSRPIYPRRFVSALDPWQITAWFTSTR